MKPSTKLKGLNWVKIPPMKVKNSFWNNPATNLEKEFKLKLLKEIESHYQVKTKLHEV